MRSYKLNINAKDDLYRIYHYGLENYGLSRAESYVEQFFEAFEKIAQNPSLYPASADRADYRVYTLLPDTIYYRINRGVVEIMAVIRRQDKSVWVH